MATRAQQKRRVQMARHHTSKGTGKDVGGHSLRYQGRIRRGQMALVIVSRHAKATAEGMHAMSDRISEVAAATKRLRSFHQDHKADTLQVGLENATLKDLRTMAQQRGIRIDGKRPSLCSKADLIVALKAAMQEEG